MDAPAVVNAGVTMTGSAEEPFMIQLFGVRNYFIIKPKDITQAFRNLTTLSFDRYLDDFVCAFGVRRSDLSTINSRTIHLESTFPESAGFPKTGLRIKDYIHWAYKRQLASDKVDELWNVYFNTIQEACSKLSLQRRSGASNAAAFKVQLRELLQDTISHASTKMLFGKKIFLIEPQIATHVQGFVDGLWKLVYRYPRWARPALTRDHDKTLHGLATFFETIDLDSSDVCWLLKVVCSGLKKAGLHQRSNAAFLSVVWLAALANVHATTYWLLCYILYDPELQQKIRNEIQPAFQESNMDIQYIVNQCPLLNSAFQEVLRLHITSNTVRYIEAPTTFQDKTLDDGNSLMIPLRQLNHSERIWGPNHDSFDSVRFIKQKSLSSHQAFRPFGGGANLCPGKSFAFKQVLGYVAYLVYTFRIELVPINGHFPVFPRNEHDTLAFGVSVPKKGMDPIVGLTPCKYK